MLLLAPFGRSAAKSVTKVTSMKSEIISQLFRKLLHWPGGRRGAAAPYFFEAVRENLGKASF